MNNFAEFCCFCFLLSASLCRKKVSVQCLNGDSLHGIYFIFQAFGSILEHLDFAHNEISYLPVEFCQSLTNLKTFDLSGNKFVQFDVSPLHHVSELKIEHSPYLESLEFTQNHLTQFKTFSAKNCSKLSQFCPWIIWSSPLLHTLDLGKF